jgi:thymidylate synthase (FAD)
MSVKHYPLHDGTGYVELLSSMGTDLTVINAARISLAKESASFSGQDEKLLNYLMREGHGSPFEHIVISYRVKAPLFVIRQWERHRIASYNEQSGRWTSFEPEFYIPYGDADIKQHSLNSFSLYEQKLAEGMPKEKARIALPVNLYTTFWFTVNGRSLMNFIALRNNDHAQEEIRLYAKAVENIFQQLFPFIHASFVKHERKAP